MNISKIKTYVYTVSKNKYRQELITTMLDKLQFSNWSFIYGKETNPYWVGIHDDFIEMLKTPAPFILLEDDAAEKTYEADIEYPNDAQIIYLGGSSNGEKNIEHYDKSKLTFSKGSRTTPYAMLYGEIDNNYIRPYNMHSHHAVLFLDNKLNEDIIKIIKNNNKAYATDVILAEEMYRRKVYCRKQPMFYQTDGRQNEQTLNYFP